MDIITYGTKTINSTAISHNIWLKSHNLGEQCAHSPSNFEYLNYNMAITTSTQIAADSKYIGLKWANDKMLAFMKILTL